MDDRGSALAEALIVTTLVAFVWAAAAGVLVQLPAQAAKWEDASAMRQRLRVVETRIGRIAAAAGPIVVAVDGTVVRIPSIWPRRLGLTRPGGAAEVSAAAATFLSRVDGHRVLTLAGTLQGTGGEVSAVPEPSCGTQVWCGVGEGDVVLLIARDGACGLFRVEAAGTRPRLMPLLPSGAASFPPSSVMLPIAVDALSFDPDESAIRRYDGYRSDNVMTDGVRALSIDWMLPHGALRDGPFIGTGPMAYDTDQLALRNVSLTLELVESVTGPSLRVALLWRLRTWP